MYKLCINGFLVMFKKHATKYHSKCNVLLAIHQLNQIYGRCLYTTFWCPISSNHFTWESEGPLSNILSYRWLCHPKSSQWYHQSTAWGPQVVRPGEAVRVPYTKVRCRTRCVLLDGTIHPEKRWWNITLAEVGVKVEFLWSFMVW